MARTIEDLEKAIAFNEQMLASGGNFLSKTISGGLQREIASLRKRIEEIRLAQVRLADGTIVGEGSVVWGFNVPTLDQKGNVVNYQVHARTVQSTKRDVAGIGYISFQKAEAKFQRLTWYEADRFFSSQDAAEEGVLTVLTEKLAEAEAKVSNLRELLDHVQSVAPTVSDYTGKDSE